MFFLMSLIDFVLLFLFLVFFPLQTLSFEGVKEGAPPIQLCSKDICFKPNR